MIIAYTLFGPDNDSFMFDEGYPSYCNICKNPISYGIMNKDFVLKRKSYDISYTYDGYFIVSEKFKEFCEEENCDNITFTTFSSEPGFYYFQALSELKFDADKRGVRFINQCKECKQFDEIIGVTPAYLIGVKKEIKEGIYRSDLLFGSGKDKSPLIIIGTEIYKKMQKKKMKGMDCEEIKI